MAKLELGAIAADKPIKLSLELPGSLHRNLALYAELLASEQGQAPLPPEKLIVPMLERFIATDRAFIRRRREGN